MVTKRTTSKGAPSGASEPDWQVSLGGVGVEANSIKSQRGAAHALAKAIESGEVLAGPRATWAGAIVSGMAEHFPRAGGRPRKDEATFRQAYAVACKRSGDALMAGAEVLPEDRPSASLALLAWARGLNSTRGKGRTAKVPSDAAVLVEMAHASGKSKRQVIGEIAERSSADTSNVERAVAAGRKDAAALLRWAEQTGAGIHPKRRR